MAKNKKAATGATKKAHADVTDVAHNPSRDEATERSIGREDYEVLAPIQN